MKKRSLSVPLVVLVAVVALVVGSLGTATAAGLTTKQVRKIAAKVVTKKASGLTVAKAALADKATLADNATNATNATNAGNATNLGGVPASGYARRIFARISYTDATPSITAGSAGITTGSESALGFPLVTFPQSMDNCAVVAITASGAGTQIIRRSTGFAGVTIQFAVKDDAGAAVRANFDVIGVC